VSSSANCDYITFTDSRESSAFGTSVTSMIKWLFRTTMISESPQASRMSPLLWVIILSAHIEIVGSRAFCLRIFLLRKHPVSLSHLYGLLDSGFECILIDEELTFIHPDDVDLYNAWDSRAFELQVANHELLGHGSGKLFQEDADGKKNFDPEKVYNYFAT